MKTSEKIAFVSLALGVAAGFGANYFTNDLFPTWAYWLFGASVTAGFFKEFLRLCADESVVDSKVINRK
jgi:hypothetical protein